MKQQLIHISRIGLAGLVGLVGLVLAACSNREAPYITEPTLIDLAVKTDKVTASTAQISITPLDDRAYYYVECVPADSAYRPGKMDRDFMILVMDSVYIDYLEWRHDLLVEGENYIAPFTSHCLKYGAQDLHLTLLSPLTEYMVYAFCVNPVSNQPMGQLFYSYFTTDSLSDVSMSFQFYAENDILYVLPSNDDRYYVFDYMYEDTYKEFYHSSPVEALSSVVDFYREFHLEEYMLRKNAYQEYLNYRMDPDVSYILLAAAYDGAVSQQVTVARMYVDPDGKPHIVKIN